MYRPWDAAQKRGTRGLTIVIETLIPDCDCDTDADSERFIL
jgi:hypothetical protein